LIIIIDIYIHGLLITLPDYKALSLNICYFTRKVTRSCALIIWHGYVQQRKQLNECSVWFFITIGFYT